MHLILKGVQVRALLSRSRLLFEKIKKIVRMFLYLCFLKIGAFDWVLGRIHRGDQIGI